MKTAAKLAALAALGIVSAADAQNTQILDSDACRPAAPAMMELIAAPSNRKLPPLLMDPKFAKSTRERATEIIEKCNEPGMIQQE